MTRGERDSSADPANINDIHAQARRDSEEVLQGEPVAPVVEKRSLLAGHRDRQEVRRIQRAERRTVTKSERKIDRTRMYALGVFAGGVVVSAIAAYATLKANSESIPEAAGLVAGSLVAGLGVKYAPGGFKQKVWYVPLAAMVAGGLTYGALESDSATDITGNSDDDPAFVGGGLVCDTETDATMIRTPWDTLEAYMGTTDGPTLQLAGEQLAESNPDFNPRTVPAGGSVPVYTDCAPALSPSAQP